MTTSLTCPKCGGQMSSYERNRVLVDQCTGCGGLFLDRGELEKLVTAENEWHAMPAAASPPQDRTYAGPQDRPNDRGYDDRKYEDRKYEDRKYEDRKYEDRKYEDRKYDDRRYGHHQPYRKKKSFLSELFDD